MAATAISRLTGAFEETFKTPQELESHEAPVVVLSWPCIPVEIVRAAGLRPMVARGGTAATPAADAHLEHEIFPSRLRQLVDAALTGRLSNAARIVIPRTSDPDYKCFLYLREFVRLGIASTLAPIVLFDLLQSEGPDVLEYNAARTRVLLDELASVRGRAVSQDDLRHEIEQTNIARAAARRLIALRRGSPRVSGTEVFPLLGAFWNLPPKDYATLADAAADEIAQRPKLAGPRVLLAGSPVDGPDLHRAIESRGAVVVSEVGPWGSGLAGDDVVCGEDTLAALATRYSRDTISARTPRHLLSRWIAHDLDDVDAVVVSLPPEDTAFGWDYPALGDLLETRHIPHTCLYGDPCLPLLPEDHLRLSELVNAAAMRTEVHGG